MARFEVVVAVRVPSAVERELRRRAREDDRPLSSYLRRELTRMVRDVVAADAGHGTAARAREDVDA